MDRATSLVLLSLVLTFAQGLSRQDLLEELKFKQLTRSTFDSRVHQKVKPIGTIAGEPIWPRVLERVSSSAELFFDDDNFAYRVNHVGPEHLLRQIEAKEKYEKVMNFLDRILDQN